MGLYHVKLADTMGKTIHNDRNAAIVQADSVDDAKQIMKAYVGAPSDGSWGEATATLMAEATDLEDWRVRITVREPDEDILEEVTITAVSGDDFDDVGDDLVVALNATASIANAAYSTPTLTVAGAADNLGDHTVECALLPPTSWDDDTIVLSGLFGTITHEGSSGSALTVVLNNIKTPEVKYQITD